MRKYISYSSVSFTGTQGLKMPKYLLIFSTLVINLFIRNVTSSLISEESILSKVNETANKELEDEERAALKLRSGRLLNIFQIVKFPNDACNATGGNFYGTCYTATECNSLGG